MRADFGQPALIWNDGKMEQWNIGPVLQTLKMSVFDFHYIIPTLHYSILPDQKRCR